MVEYIGWAIADQCFPVETAHMDVNVIIFSIALLVLGHTMTFTLRSLALFLRIGLSHSLHDNRRYPRELLSISSAVRIDNLPHECNQIEVIYSLIRVCYQLVCQQLQCSEEVLIALPCQAHVDPDEHS